MSSVPFRYDPARCALIVIDMQNDFCSPDGSLAQKGFDVTAPVAMAPRLDHLVASARTAGVRVIFVRTLHDETTDTPQWLGRIGEGRTRHAPELPAAQEHPGQAITPSLRRTATW